MSEEKVVVNPDQEFSFQLTYAEADKIIKALGKLPYEEVMHIIPKMQNQFEAQRQLPQEPEPMSDEDSTMTVAMYKKDNADDLSCDEPFDIDSIEPAQAPGSE